VERGKEDVETRWVELAARVHEGMVNRSSDSWR
jgi:hypothetical protein